MTRTIFILAIMTTQLCGQDRQVGQVHQQTTLVYPPARHAPLHRASAVHLFAYMALIGRTDVTPSDPRGLATTRLRYTDDPENPYDDDDLTVYGVNSGQDNIIFNSSMQSIDIYEGKGPKQRLKRPRGIACTPDGVVYVADTGNNRLVKLYNPGSYLTFVGSFGKKGKKPGQFSEPRGVAVTSDGRVFVTDYGNDRIQVFDSNMTFLHILGEKTDSASVLIHMAAPDAIAVVDSMDPDNAHGTSFLVVVDLNNSRIRKLSLDGSFMAGAGSSDYGYPRVHITSLAIDLNGNIWATDLFNHCIHKFDKDLRHITTFGHIGRDDGEFFEPRAIAIGKRFGQVFVADKESAQYLHIGTDIINFDITLQDSLPRFDFTLTEPSLVSARILDASGRFITTLCVNRWMPLGRNTLLWDKTMFTRRLRNGLPLIERLSTPTDSLNAPSVQIAPGGLYKVIVEARTKYIYNRYFVKKLEVEFAF